MSVLKLHVVTIITLSASTILNSMQMPPIQELTLDEKIGQLLMVATVADPDNPISKDVLFRRSIKEIPSIKQGQELEQLIKDYHIGGILFLGKSSATQQFIITQQLIAINQQANKIPLLFALDAEWGPAMRIDDATKFPFNITLGAIRDKGMIKEMGFAIGTMLKSLGTGINFGPVADCNTNRDNPIINRRSFGENPQMVSTCVQQYINGLQDAGIAACAKHFPGHGDTATDTHTGLAIVNHSRDRLDTVEFIPFKAAIKSGVKAIMTAHILVPSLDAENPATLSPLIMKQIVRHDLAYDGIVCTDALDMDAITQKYQPEESVLQALLAGNDIIVAPVDIPKAVQRIKEALTTSIITINDIDTHVAHILTLKNWIEQQKESHAEPVDIISTILNSNESQELSRRLYKKAITVVRNNGVSILRQAQDERMTNTILPIVSHQEPLSIIAIGTDTVPLFANVLQRTNRCTLHLLPATRTTQQYEDLLRNLSGTIIIGIYGLTYGKSPFGISPEAQQFVNQVCKQHTQVVVVLFGNPYALALFPGAPALIAAYEDHPYAQEAAANVIIGKNNPEGILPITASEELPAGKTISY